jgi:serine/threonine protein kinase
MYSYGNVIYVLLQEEYPFARIKTDEAKQLVMDGVRPDVYIDIWNSTDPVIQALKEAMILCHEHDPEKRISARELETFLKSQMREFDPGRLEEWGDA